MTKPFPSLPLPLSHMVVFCHCSKPCFLYTNVSKGIVIFKCNTCEYLIEEIRNTTNTYKKPTYTNTKFHCVQNLNKSCHFRKTFKL
uniref:Uncharacterized protein n=1 Tax=viral metagenome TaxID=1070528 RepID=A0A6C0CPE9_9ZZZZ